MAAISGACSATIVRIVLLPASTTLLGRWNWYLPSWLDWLPRRPGAKCVPARDEASRSLTPIVR